MVLVVVIFTGETITHDVPQICENTGQKVAAEAILTNRV